MRRYVYVQNELRASYQATGYVCEGVAFVFFDKKTGKVSMIDPRTNAIEPASDADGIAPEWFWMMSIDTAEFAFKERLSQAAFDRYDNPGDYFDYADGWADPNTRYLRPADIGMEFSVDVQRVDPDVVRLSFDEEDVGQDAVDKARYDAFRKSAGLGEDEL